MLDEIINGAIETPKEEVSNSNETITISREEFMNKAREISAEILQSDKERADKEEKNMGMMPLVQVIMHFEFATKLCNELFGKENK